MACGSLHTLFLFLLLAGLCDATTDYNILDFAMARKHEAWMAEHGRVYKDEVEKARRFEIFKKNMEYIEDFNSVGDHSYTFGANQFADLTSEEFAASYIRCKDTELTEFEESVPIGSFKNETLEEPLTDYSVDWRDRGAVTPVKDQGPCGSCWAMAVVSTVESLVKIKNHGLHELSEQQILDCNKEGKGCGSRGTRSNGGTRRLAFNYIAGNKGLALRKDYPYTAKDGICDKVKEKKVVSNTAISGYARVRPATEKDLMAAVTSQPVTVGVAFPRDILQFYDKGIFDGPCGKDNDHVVTVVGYGQEASVPYWIVRNTWGTSWGERGYIRMKRFIDDRNPEGLCEIAKYGSYPTM